MYWALRLAAAHTDHASTLLTNCRTNLVGKYCALWRTTTASNRRNRWHKATLLRRRVICSRASMCLGLLFAAVFMRKRCERGLRQMMRERQRRVMGHWHGHSARKRLVRNDLLQGCEYSARQGLKLLIFQNLAALRQRHRSLSKTAEERCTAKNSTPALNEWRAYANYQRLLRSRISQSNRLVLRIARRLVQCAWMAIKEQAQDEYLMRVKRKHFMVLTLYERPVRFCFDVWCTFLLSHRLGSQVCFHACMYVRTKVSMCVCIHECMQVCF